MLVQVQPTNIKVPNLSNAGQLFSYAEPRLRTKAGPRMHSYSSPEILVTVLRSTSFLLEHYGYSGHDPSLSELQRSLARATAQLEAQVPADHTAPNVFESQQQVALPKPH